MQNLLRGTILVLLFITIFIPAAALDENLSDFDISQPPVMDQSESENATVRIIPDEAAVGEQHTILVTGLAAGEDATIRIIFEDDNSVVYEAPSTASGRGIIELEIFTEESDSPGTYRIEVINNSGVVIATDTLIVTAPEEFSNLITVSPLEAEAGTIFTIDISDTRPFTVLEIFIENEDGEEVFSQRLRSSVDGSASVTFDSSETEAGILTLSVVEDEAKEIFNQEITVSGQPFPATVVIEPSEALPGDTVFVTVSDLTPEEAVIIEISLNDELITTIEETANVSGLVVFTYDFALDDSRGTYHISVSQNDEQVGFQTLLVDILPVTLEVTPGVATIGTLFLATVSDLQPDEEVTIELLRDGTVIQTQSQRANTNGSIRTLLGRGLSLEIASYEVRVLRMGEVNAVQTVEIVEEPPEVTATIEPASAAIPAIYALTVDGVPAGTALDIVILLNGESVASFPGTVDENGDYSTEIGTDENDLPGIYTIEISANDEVIATVDLEATEADTVEESDDSSETGAENADEEATDDTNGENETQNIAPDAVTLNINPEQLLRGERIEFIATNLEADEIVTFELWFEDTVIYSVERTADATGSTGVALVAQDDEAFGDYEMRVLRDGEIIASDTFQIVPEADISTAQISITPQNGVRGTEYIITASGLEAGEEIELIVNFADESVFETTRSANTDGTLTIRINSDETDEIGTYDVIIMRENANNLESSFTIEEGELETIEDEPPATETNLDVDPLSGTIGTNHTVTVTGLEAEEEFSLTIEFNGESVYTVTRTADSEGNFSTTISTDESDLSGDYDIIIERSNADNLSETIQILGDEDEVDAGDEPNTDFQISITPDVVDEEEPFDVVVSGLNAGEEIRIEVEFDGEIVFDTNRAADDEGEVEISLRTFPGDPVGIYSVSAIRGDEQISANVEVLPVEDSEDIDDNTTTINGVAINVEPESGTIGSNYEFTISGLDSNEEIAIQVEFDDEIVFESERTADASGFAIIELNTEETDPPGVYTFIVLQDGELTVSIEFELEASDAPIDEEDEPIIDVDAPENISAAVYADAIAIEFDADTSLQLIEFDGQSGDVIDVTVDSNNSLDTLATLISPDGKIIASDDDGGQGFDPEIERAVLPDTGIYTLEIRSFNPGDSGTASVTINRTDERNLIDVETRSITLNSKITEDVLTFFGRPGETISLEIELETGTIGDLHITAEQADTTLMTYQTSGLPQSIILGFSIPETGNVIIRLQSDGTGNAILNLSIEKQ